MLYNNNNNNDLLQIQGPYCRHSKRRISTKKWLALTHYRTGVCTWWHGRKKIFNITQIVASMSYTHHNTGIQQCERNECIPTSKFEVNS